MKQYWHLIYTWKQPPYHPSEQAAMYLVVEVLMQNIGPVQQHASVLQTASFPSRHQRKIFAAPNSVIEKVPQLHRQRIVCLCS